MISVYTVAYLEPKAGLPRSGGENSCNGLNFETEIEFRVFPIRNKFEFKFQIKCEYFSMQ